MNSYDLSMILQDHESVYSDIILYVFCNHKQVVMLDANAALFNIYLYF